MKIILNWIVLLIIVIYISRFMISLYISGSMKNYKYTGNTPFMVLVKEL